MATGRQLTANSFRLPSAGEAGGAALGSSRDEAEDSAEVIREVRAKDRSQDTGQDNRIDIAQGVERDTEQDIALDAARDFGGNSGTLYLIPILSRAVRVLASSLHQGRTRLILHGGNATRNPPAVKPRAAKRVGWEQQRVK